MTTQVDLDRFFANDLHKHRRELARALHAVVREFGLRPRRRHLRGAFYADSPERARLLEEARNCRTAYRRVEAFNALRTAAVGTQRKDEHFKRLIQSRLAFEHELAARIPEKYLDQARIEHPPDVDPPHRAILRALELWRRDTRLGVS